MSALDKFYVLRTHYHTAGMASGEIIQVHARIELKNGTNALKRKTVLNRNRETLENSKNRGQRTAMSVLPKLWW